MLNNILYDKIEDVGKAFIVRKALFYKFAGRWDNVTSNTLTNLF